MSERLHQKIGISRIPKFKRPDKKFPDLSQNCEYEEDLIGSSLAIGLDQHIEIASFRLLGKIELGSVKSYSDKNGLYTEQSEPNLARFTLLPKSSHVQPI